MFLLEILGGWLLLSCLTAPLIGRFLAFGSINAEDAPHPAWQFQQMFGGAQPASAGPRVAAQDVFASADILEFTWSAPTDAPRHANK